MDSAVIAAPATLIITYLTMASRADFRPAFLPPEQTRNLTLMRMNGVDVGFYRFLYGSVGAIWRWRDRLVIPEEELAALLTKPGTTVDVLYADGIPAGYFELRPADGGATELAYFGLRPVFFGRGWGKHLLSLAIQQAWDDGAKRLDVHTCNMDGPYALENYRKRGFAVVSATEEPMPERYT